MCVSVCLDGGREANPSVCTCPLVCLCVFKCVPTSSGDWNEVCVWGMFQWPNTAPIEVSPTDSQPDHRFLSPAWMKNIPHAWAHTQTYKSVESPLACLEKPGVLRDWIPLENTHHSSYSVPSVLHAFGINLSRRRRKPRTDENTFQKRTSDLSLER